ncbi:MAG: hypothetical protein JEZ04_12930 [Spirochaetales bacterium]|nr:hypothetical protein [Spirochaetales bacterium]
MFNLITSNHETEIIKLIDRIKTAVVADIAGELAGMIEKIRADIPEKKRISLGRYSIIKQIGIFIYPILLEKGIDAIAFGAELFRQSSAEPFIRSLGIQLISVTGEQTGELEEVLSFFEQAASDDDWVVRECSSGFVRKLVKSHPEPVREWYISMVKSDDPLRRRFASESLRPVADNGWLKKSPEFAFSILEHLYHESADYPRTSAGNSLSDWMRVDEEKTMPIVKELATNGDPDSHWIAARACRNLVKKDPLLVMDILKTDSYIYKDRKYYRKDYE